MNKIAIYNPSIVSKIFLFALYFLYMFSLQFAFVPGGLGTRVIFGAVGLIYLIAVRLEWIAAMFQKRELSVKKHQFRIIVALLLFLAAAVGANLANGTSEKNFLAYPISMTMIFTAAFMIVDLTRRIYRRLTFEVVSNYFVAIVLAQVYIALVMFFVPEIKILTTKVLVTEGLILDEILDEDGFRLMGFGVQFFGAGIINSVTLMLIAMLFRSNCNSLRRAFYLTFAFISIFGLGMMMARTTLVGAGMALGLLILSPRKIERGHKNLRRVFISFGAIAAFVVTLFGTLSIDSQEMISTAGEYGFEMFVNYFETGEASTSSTDQLKEMYKTYPTEFKTWLVGDGLFADPANPGFYYMGTDVGYIRLIFYCGLMGMFAFIFYQLSLLTSINKNTDGQYRLFLVFIFIFILIVNFKGFADLTSQLALFMFFTPQLCKSNG